MSNMIAICIGFLAGIAGFYSGHQILSLVAVFVVVILNLDLKKLKKTASWRIVGMTTCIVASFFTAQVFCKFYESRHIQQLPEEYFNHKVEIVGVVTEDPDRGIKGTKVTIKPLSIDGELLSNNIKDRILVRLGIGVDITYGDTIKINSMIEIPEPFLSDTGREFDYPQYLSLNDIVGIARAYDFEIIPPLPLGEGLGVRVVEKLYATKQFFVEKIKSLYPSPESGFLAGIVIGVKSLMPDDIMNDFQIAGLTHMVVLSGYNITIVTTVFVGLFATFGFGYKPRRLLSVGAIALFIIMTGLNASAVRAGIMATIAVILQITSRPAHTMRIILFTLCAMIISNPRALLWDPSLHLSFLAFFGLAYVAPITSAWVEKWPNPLGLTKIFGETLGVQLFVLPYILWMSGTVSVLSLLANIITVPVIPILMAAGFASIIGSLFFAPLGIMLALPVKWGLSYVIYVAHLIASVNIATFTIPPFGVGIMIGVYVSIMIFLTFWTKRGEK